METNCIFCTKGIDDTEVQAEHIIPSSIDGTVVCYSVCGECNHSFSQEVDTELSQHFKTYNAWKKHEHTHSSKKVFRFREKYLRSEDGIQIKMSPRSDRHKFLSTKLSDGGIVVPSNVSEREDPFVGYLRKEQKNRCIDEETFLREHLEPYRHAKSEYRHNRGQYYQDWLFDKMYVVFSETVGRITYAARTRTPHRFVAKACVEYAKLIGIHDELLNLEDLVHHARFGGYEETKLSFNESMGDEYDEIHPCHAIAFTEDQFTVGLYDFHWISVGIAWKSTPKCCSFVDDYQNKKLRIARKRDGVWTFNTESNAQFRHHEDIGRPTNIRK